MKNYECKEREYNLNYLTKPRKSTKEEYGLSVKTMWTNLYARGIKKCHALSSNQAMWESWHDISCLTGLWLRQASLETLKRHTCSPFGIQVIKYD